VKPCEARLWMAGPAERTLRAVCQQHLGFSPIRYLSLQRVHLAPQALLKPDATSTTVTWMATDQGFWERGVFCIAYCSLFGESPSATLRRRPQDDQLTLKIFPFALPLPFRHRSVRYGSTLFASNSGRAAVSHGGKEHVKGYRRFDWPGRCSRTCAASSSSADKSAGCSSIFQRKCDTE
jgi:hypothetical protein